MVREGVGGRHGWVEVGLNVCMCVKERERERRFRKQEAYTLLLQIRRSEVRRSRTTCVPQRDATAALVHLRHPR